MPNSSPKIAHPLPSALRSRAGWVRWLEMRRPAQPHVHQIEPTNHCPYTCVMCPRTERMTRPLGFMDMALYTRLIEEIAGFAEPQRAREIELYHFGESLLHPELESMVAQAAGRGLRVALSVNAPHLTPAHAEKLLAAGAHKLIVSLDGHDDASYRAVRGRVASFETAQTNLAALAQLLKTMPRHGEVVVRSIAFNANQASIEPIRSLTEGLGLSAEIRQFFPWTHAELTELGDYQRLPPLMPCPFPWQYLVVQWDGRVVPCCRDYNAVNVMGDTNHQTLREIWNGERYAAFREAHANADFQGNPICRECMGIYGKNELLPQASQ